MFRRLVIAAVLPLLAVVLGGTSAGAAIARAGHSVSVESGPGSSRAASEATLSAAAAANPKLVSVGCGSATSCVAVGWYTDSSGQYKGLLVSGSGSNWTAVPVPLPRDAAPSRDGVNLVSVACPSPGTCVAVGEYIDSSGYRQGLLLTGSGSNWTAVKAPLPGGAALNPQVFFFFSSVACPAANTCVVAGGYDDFSGDWQGVLLTGLGSTWSTVKAPLPADAAAGPEVDLNSVACSSATACVVAGSYPCNDTNNCQAGLLLAGSGTTWTTVKAPLPANAQPGAALGVLGCASGGNCLAAGSYADSSGNAQGLLESGSGSNWTPAEAPLPPGAVADPYVFFSSAACPSVGTCVVTGGYNGAGGEGLLLTSSGSNWTAAKAPVPANARTQGGGGLDSVACATATSCLAVGLYGTISDQAQGLLEEGSGSNWAPTEAPLPAGAAKGDHAGSDLRSVACPSTSTCVAVGSYTDSSDHGQGLLLTRSGSNWTAVKAPLSPDRYLALGDSVPYGTGLANPGKKSHNGLPPDQGPSPSAWPSLVDQAVPGLASLTLRPTSCALTGPKGARYDQLAVNGAPTEVDPWTGKDDDCHYTTPVPLHKAVVPNEIKAANLAADPPSLVTIQAGADDIDFGGCLAALLGLPSQAGADKCVTRDKSGYHLTAKASAELTFVKTGLQKVIADVLASAPNAQVVLVDYYQIIPTPSTPIEGTSAICRDIRAAKPGGTWRTNLRNAADYVQARLNGTIEAAATYSPQAAVVDITNLFSGHEMCTQHSWLFDGGIFTHWRAAHPTKTGQAHIADAVISECESLPNHCLGYSSGSDWSGLRAPQPPDGALSQGSGLSAVVGRGPGLWAQDPAYRPTRPPPIPLH